MAVFHSTAAQTIAPIAALERLEAAISQVRGQHEGNFERLERELHALFVTAERELLGEELERLDIDVPSVLVEGEVHHRVLRGTETYTSAAGPGDGDAQPVSFGQVLGGGADGAAGRHGGGSLDAVGGAPGAVGGDASDAGRGGRAVSRAGQHAPVEELSGPVTETAR